MSKIYVLDLVFEFKRGMELVLLVGLLCTVSVVVNGVEFDPESDKWIQGQYGSFSCSNPVSVIVNKNGNEVTTCFTDGVNNFCSKPAPSYATVNVTGNTLNFTILNVDRARDSANWECGGTTTNIDVKIPVPSATIENKNSLTFTEGEITSITCKTGVSYPPATITWSVGGTIINGATTTNNSDGTTTSILQYNATKSDHNKILQCSATNGFGSTQSDSMTLNNRFGVTSVTIENKNSLKFTDGNTTSITCKTGVSNPPATITWSIGGININGATTTNNPDGTTTSILQYTADKTDHNKILQCSATNGFGSTQSDSIILNIRFGVPSATIENKNSLTFADGKTTSITFKTGVSYPPATIKWYIGGTNIDDATTTNNPDGTTTSIYQYTADIIDNNKTLQCSAFNDVGSPKSDSLTLTIIAAPEIIGGQDCISVAVIVYSNPQPKCEWLFNGKASDETFTIVSDGYQHICKLSSNINPRDIPSGDYYVNVSNALGWTSRTIKIPQIKDPFPDHLLAVQIIHIIAVFLVFLVISCSDKGAKFMQGVSIASVVLIVVCMGLLIYLLVKLQEEAWIITSSLVIVFTVLTAVIIILINRISILTKIKDEHWYVGLVVSCVITILFSLAALIYLVVTLSQYDVCKKEYLGAGVGFQAVDVLVIALLLVTVLKMKTGSGTSRYHVCRVVRI